MKKLIIAAVLGLTFSFSTLSFAGTQNVFGVEVPVTKKEVNSQVMSGDVEGDFMSFYISPKEASSLSSQIVDNEPEKDSEDYITVFGVNIATNRGV